MAVSSVKQLIFQLFLASQFMSIKEFQEIDKANESKPSANPFGDVSLLNLQKMDLQERSCESS